MDLRDLLPLYYDFYIVAREGNVTQASISNHIAQPTLSKNIRLLEESLHCSLFTRTNKGMELTLMGESIYKKLDAIFSSFCKDEKSFLDKNLNGTLYIGVTKNVVNSRLSDYLTAFHQSYPNIKVVIEMNNSETLKRLLISHKIDILIDYLPNSDYSDGSDLIVKVFGRFDTCFACSKKFYTQNDLTNLDFKDLNNYHLVLPGVSRRRQFLDNFFQERNLTLESSIEFPDWNLALDYVQKNDSIGYFFKEEILNTDLISLNMKENLPQICFGIVFSQNSFNPITEKFVFLVEELCDFDF